MALGGGTFLTQNKVLPGSYINFISASNASATLSDRGFAAMALALDWGPDGDIFTVTNDEFMKDSMKIFGYEYTHAKLKGLRDLFLNTKTAYLYRVNAGTKATCELADAKYSGTRGNSLKITVVANESLFEVTTLLDDIAVDAQTVATAADLVDNDYVVFKKTASLSANPTGVALSSGTDGTENTAAHQAFLDKAEAYSFNTLGCVSTVDGINDLYVAYTKRMRDECGIKFQTVLFQEAADYEGIINVENEVLDDSEAENSLVYWVTGASAGANINESNTNRVYDGNFSPDYNYTQAELEAALKAGKFIFHKVGDEIRVLDDINSFVSATDDKSADFSSNQVIRVLDQVGNDIAVLFNTKYLGKVQNNKAGRVALWNDIVKYNRELEGLSAIEDFVADEVIVEMGDDKKSVVVTNPITPVCAMTKLYMTVIVQ